MIIYRHILHAAFDTYDLQRATQAFHFVIGGENGRHIGSLHPFHPEEVDIQEEEETPQSGELVLVAKSEIAQKRGDEVKVLKKATVTNPEVYEDKKPAEGFVIFAPSQSRRPKPRSNEPRVLRSAKAGRESDE